MCEQLQHLRPQQQPDIVKQQRLWMQQNGQRQEQQVVRDAAENIAAAMLQLQWGVRRNWGSSQSRRVSSGSNTQQPQQQECSSDMRGSSLTANGIGRADRQLQPALSNKHLTPQLAARAAPHADLHRLPAPLPPLQRCVCVQGKDGEEGQQVPGHLGQGACMRAGV
jgi:hypothetical protein